MLIQAYGLFWRRDEIEWSPGRGKRNIFSLLGRRGSNIGKLRLADFRGQQGIYILYDNYGPFYAGLTREQTLGKRLSQHQNKVEWDRFCWFGFKRVLKGKHASGLNSLSKNLATVKLIQPRAVIKDFEAILIKSMALRNIADSNFSDAEEWFQVGRVEKERYLAKVR